MRLNGLLAFRGCLLGGAIGDALGYQVEFSTIESIRVHFGAAGVQGLDKNAFISDDTQMTLFTAEGLSRAAGKDEHAAIHEIYLAYKRWLDTQLQMADLRPEHDGLASDPRLYARRAPGHTCMSALMSGRIGHMDEPINNSKGCGGVMRAAPCGLQTRYDAFRLGCASAALTHSHPCGYISAGALAYMVSALTQGATLENAVYDVMDVLRQWPRHEDTLAVFKQAVELAGEGKPTPEKVETLGGGWVGEEALAIAVYAALCHPTDAQAALLTSVNHSGDSDSTGAICGNLMGALLGEYAFPKEWREHVELNDLALSAAETLYKQSTNMEAHKA